MTYYFCKTRALGGGAPILVFEEASTIPVGYEIFGYAEGDSPKEAYLAWAERQRIRVSYVSMVDMPKTTVLYIKLKQPWEK